MANICGCPKAATLPDIPGQICPFKVGQIQKFAAQRLYETADTLNGITDPTKLASWTELLAAEDNSKVVISPFIQEPTTEPGAVITFGGGNTSLGGVTVITGRELTTFVAYMRWTDQAIIKAMRPLECEDGDLGVYLFTQRGGIVALRVNTGSAGSPTYIYRPIPISSFSIGALNLGGLEEPDSNEVSWSFSESEWSDDIVLITPEFNPLRALRTT